MTGAVSGHGSSGRLVSGFHRTRESTVVGGSTWVISGFLIQAVTGVAFWVLAARLYQPEAVGAASALFASIQFVNYATSFGQQEMLARHHALDRRLGGSLFTWSVIVTASTSVLGALLFLVVIQPDAIEHLDAAGPTGRLAFAALAAGSALALIADVVLMAGRRWRIVFTRLLVVGVARLPLAALPLVGPVPLRLLVAVSGPIALSGFLGAMLVPRLSGLRYSFRTDPALAAAARYAGVNYVSHLAYQAPQFMIPVLVLLQVDPIENANFFIAWTIVALLAIVPLTVSRVLLSESTKTGISIADETRRAMVFALAIMGSALLAGLAGLPLIEAVFGPGYGELTDLLPMLLLGGIPSAVATVLLGYARGTDDHVASVVIPAVLAVTTVGIALAAIPDRGAQGAAIAWLAGNSVTALVAVQLVARRPAGQFFRRMARPLRRPGDGGLDPGSRSGSTTAR